MKEYKNCRNPLLPVHLHIPDGEAHVMPDGRVYVYGSWDQYEDDTYCSKEYRVISSANMVDWVDHGISFDSSQVDWFFDKNKPQYPKVDWDWNNPTLFMQGIIKRYFTKDQNENKGGNTESEDSKIQEVNLVPDLLYAPDAIYRDGKYYLYFCAQDNTEGVAVADKPEGPFKDPVRLPCGGIDPAVFIDDDGQAYYYWGQLRASGAKLKENMVEFEEGSVVRRIVTEEEHGFHEGSSMRKRNGTYYFVYACIKRGKPTSLAYATSKSPLGPFVYRGIIIDNDGSDPQIWNNHGSIEEVNGQWYVFYHRSSRNQKNKRRLCIEPICFNEDGSIQEVPMTSQGAGRPFARGEAIEAYRACQLSGSVFISPLYSGMEGLTGIKDGDTAIFRYVEWEEPVKKVTIMASGSGWVTIYLDGQTKEAGRVTVSDGEMTGFEFFGAAGKHEIGLVFENSEGLEIYSICFE